MVPPMSSLSAMGALGARARSKLGEGGKVGAEGTGKSSVSSSKECLWESEVSGVLCGCDGEPWWLGECVGSGVGVGAMVG